MFLCGLGGSNATEKLLRLEDDLIHFRALKNS